MANLSISITKSSIYEEVAKTTAYLGAKNKLDDGKSAFDQIFVTDADLAMIERFYNESKDALLNLLKRFMPTIGSSTDGNINWTLSMPSRFDTNMSDSITSSATSFIVNSIVAKWCEITANDKVKEYADNASALLLDIKDKVFNKTKPTRTKI